MRDRVLLVAGVLAQASCAGMVVRETTGELHRGAPRGSTFGLGETFTCALPVSSRDLAFRSVCWGQVAWPRAPALGVSVAAVAPLGDHDPVGAVVAGDRHACAMTCELAGGASPRRCTISCWGDNRRGQLGRGTISAAQPAPAVVSVPQPMGVYASGESTCALTRTGRVYCWGDNEVGELGSAPSAPVTTPTSVDGLPPIDDLAMGRHHTCAISRARTVWCWGRNQDAELGQPATAAVVPPAALRGLPPMQKVSVGGHHACGITLEGDLLCWGRNTSGQIGNGVTSPREPGTRVRSPLGRPWTAVACGAEHTCGIVDRRQVFCWGGNEFGQAAATPTASVPSPTPMWGAEYAEFIAAGADRSCAFVRGGDQSPLRCWGRNDGGQLGDGSPGDRCGPVEVAAP